MRSQANQAVAAAVAGQRALATHSWPDGADLRVRREIQRTEIDTVSPSWLATTVPGPFPRGMMACSSDHHDMTRGRTHNLTAREPITFALTVGRELGIWRFAQRFLVVPW